MQRFSMIWWLRAGLCLLVVAAVCGVASSVQADDDGFKEVKRTHDGITVSRKPGRSSGYYDIRFETKSPVAPVALMDYLWSSFFTARPPVIERRFFKREAADIVFYDRIKTPVVSDRDYTMRIRRVSFGNTMRLEFQTTSEFGPGLDSHYVRMPIVHGFWEAGPDQQGSGSLVRYEIYSEPGGSVPAMLVRGAQLNEALEDFRRSMKEALQR